MATKAEIAVVLSMLSAAYPRYTLTADTMKAYSELVKDLPADLLKAAAIQAVTHGEFFPSVHELRREATELQRQANGIPNAFEAWADLLAAGDGERREVHEVEGKYHVIIREYPWKHELVKQVAEGLGWPRTFPGENQMADRAHFVKAYDEALRKVLDTGLMLPEVRQYIEKKQLEAGKVSNQVKTLAERISA